MEVSPTQTATGTSSGQNSSISSLAENFDNFLTLLTTQLQHQDPLAPLDSNEFTNQLVNFTGVEQQVLQNQNLEKLIALQEQIQTIGAVSYIGKVIEAAGNTNMLIDGGATFSYILPETAESAVMRVFDSSGDLVFQQTVEPTAGIHDIEWDGSTLQGGIAPDGAYAFAITALDNEELPIEVTHRILGRVTGISF